MNVRKRKDPPALSDEAIDELIKRHKKPTPETNFVEPVRLQGHRIRLELLALEIRMLLRSQ